jgi:hypothetical protein
MLFPDEDNAGCDEINGQWLNGRQVIERTLGAMVPMCQSRYDQSSD